MLIQEEFEETQREIQEETQRDIQEEFPETQRQLRFDSFDSQETLVLPGLGTTELDSDETTSPIPRDDQSFESTPTPPKDPSHRDNIEIAEKDEIAEKNGIPEIAEKDGIPEIAEKDGIPEIAEKNGIPEIAEKNGIPEIAEKDGIPEMAEKDGIPEMAEKDEIAEKNGIPEIAEKDGIRKVKKVKKKTSKLGGKLRKFGRVKKATKESEGKGSKAVEGPVENKRRKRPESTTTKRRKGPVSTTTKRRKGRVSPEHRRRVHREASKRWHDRWISKGVPRDEKETKMTAAKSKAKPTKRNKENVAPPAPSAELKMPKESHHIPVDVFFLFGGF